MTITTVGYGDFYPHTSIGRVIILFVAIWGTFIVSIMVVVVSNTLNMEKSEKRTATILQKLVLKDEHSVIAGNLIASVYRYKKAKREGNT